MPRLHWLNTLWVENFDEIALSRMVKEIGANLRFSIFDENSKWPPYVGKGKLFENCQEYTAQIPCESKKFRRNRSISHGQGDRSKFVFLPFLAKIRKFKMAAIFGEGKIFENCQEYIAQIPCGSKISTK